MHADVDEGAELGDVGDDAFKHHSRLDVGELADRLVRSWAQRTYRVDRARAYAAPPECPFTREAARGRSASHRPWSRSCGCG